MLVEQTVLMKLTAVKTLALYKAMRSAGKHLTLTESLAMAGSTHSASDFYTALIQCAGRVGAQGSANDSVHQIFDDMVQAGIDRPRAMYESAMRLLAKRSAFKEAFAVFDRLEQDGLEPSSDTLSCLIGFASELGDFDRAVAFFDKLSAKELPSIRAHMTVLKVHSKRNDWPASIALYRSMRERGLSMDAIVLNIVLSTSVACGKLSEAVTLLIEEPGVTIADVVSHNIILKGLAQQCEISKALQVLDGMRLREATPNLVSYNTVIDCAVRARQPRDAWRLFDEMSQDGNLKPDKCTCSTLVKALMQKPESRRVFNLLSLFDVIQFTCPPKLRGSLLTGLLEAATRLKDASLAMTVFARMRQLQQMPTGREVQGLAVLTAWFQDSQACESVWFSCASELASSWCAVNQSMMMGRDICAATLAVPELARVAKDLRLSK